MVTKSGYWQVSNLTKNKPPFSPKICRFVHPSLTFSRRLFSLFKKIKVPKTVQFLLIVYKIFHFHIQLRLILSMNPKTTCRDKTGGPRYGILKLKGLLVDRSQAVFNPKTVYARNKQMPQQPHFDHKGPTNEKRQKCHSKLIKYWHIGSVHWTNHPAEILMVYLNRKTREPLIHIKHTKALTLGVKLPDLVFLWPREHDTSTGQFGYVGI